MKKSLISILRIIYFALLVIATLIFVFRCGKYFWTTLWIVFEIYVLTALTRTISSKESVSTFLKGAYIGIGLVALFYFTSMKVGINVKSPFFAGFAVGTYEEFIKMIPVLLMAYLIYRRRKILPNPSDFLWMSVLSGAAFTLVETSYWINFRFPFTYGPHIGPLYFFPNALGQYYAGAKIGYIGHAAATGLIGMALGWGIFFKTKRNTILNRIWWLIPVMAYVWVVFEHAFNNIYYKEKSGYLLIFGGGQLTPYIFIVLLLLTIGFDILSLILLFRARSTSRMIFFGNIRQAFKALLKRKWGEMISRGRVVTIYLRRINLLSWKGVTIGEEINGESFSITEKNESNKED